MNYYKQIEDSTLNPKSRLFVIYEMSQLYLQSNTAFIEVGTWRGGVCGLVALSNKNKNFEIFACDTFTGVKNSSNHDTFFKNNEYADASIEDVNKVSDKVKKKFNVIEGVFPKSLSKNEISLPFSFAHIDVDTYLSAKESFEFISTNLLQGGVVILDDYGGWFTDGVTKFGEELKKDKNYFCVSNHLGQLIIFKK